MKIITITYNDLGISWGPAIHYLELWNGVSAIRPSTKLCGYFPSWTKYNPIIKPAFELKKICVPDIPLIRQIVYDLALAIILALRTQKSDLIYVRLSQFHLFSTIVLTIKKNALFLELNGLLVDDATSARRSALLISFVKWQEKILVKRAQGIICVSQGIADSISEMYSPVASVVTLNNGVGSIFFDQHGMQRQASDPIQILYVGTFTPWDGAIHIPVLAKKYPDVNFKLIGDGPGRHDVEALATSNMQFLGQIPYSELPGYYKNSDAGIVLYESERHQRVQLSSLKTLEYLASSLPVFTTDVPGQEFVAQLGCGMLANIDRIEEDFLSFLQDLPKYRQKCIDTQEYIKKRYSWEHVAQVTLSFADQVINEKKFENDAAIRKYPCKIPRFSTRMRQLGIKGLINCILKKIYLRILAQIYGFDSWHARSPYECRAYKQEVVELANELSPRVAIEVGCGLGDIISRVDDANLYGFDIDSSVINAARRINGHHADFFQADIASPKRLLENLKNVPSVDLMITVNWPHAVPWPEFVANIKLIAKKIKLKYLIIDTINSCEPGYAYHHSLENLAEVGLINRTLKSKDGVRALHVIEVQNS